MRVWPRLKLEEAVSRKETGPVEMSTIDLESKIKTGGERNKRGKKKRANSQYRDPQHNKS